MKKTSLKYGSGDVPTRYVVPTSATVVLEDETAPKEQESSRRRTA